MPDRTIVALLGPADGATCTTPGCTLLGPCVECEERRHLAAVEDDERHAAFDALPGAGPDDHDDDDGGFWDGRAVVFDPNAAD